jgi:hypothetical protein
MTRRLNALEAAHGPDNLDAIRAELTSSTICEMADRYDVERGYIARLEHFYGVKCMRMCATCKRRTLPAEMRTTASGWLGQICIHCDLVRPGQGKASTSHAARMSAEYDGVPSGASDIVRMPWGRRVEGIWCRFWQGRTA